MDRVSCLFPNITEPQVALFHTEFDTGVVLCLDGSRFDGSRFEGHGEVFLTFATFQDAYEYAVAKVKSDPNIECVIFDHDRKSLEVVSPLWTMDQ